MRGSGASDGTDGAAHGRAGAATAAAYGIACLVHLVTAGLLTGGLLLIVLGFETVVQPVVGLVMLALAGSLRPRFARLDPDLPALRRTDAPALYELLDRIADTVGVRRLDAVQVGTEFTVRAGAYGIRRRLKLEVGLPLWLTLTPQERIAAVAHELGRHASGDPRRAALVGTALASLAAGAELAEGRSGEGDTHLAASPTVRWADDMAQAAARFNARGQVANWALWLPRLAARGTGRLLLRLTRPETRRAEFRADALAARTASTEAAVRALRAQGLADSVTLEVHRLAVAAYTFGRAGGTREGEQDLWEKLAAHAAGLSDRVRDTPAEARTPGPGGAADAADGTAPPATRARVDRLLQAPHLPAVITPDATATEAIGNELRGPMRLLARKVVQDRVFA